MTYEEKIIERLVYKDNLSCGTIKRQEDHIDNLENTISRLKNPNRAGNVVKLELVR